MIYTNPEEVLSRLDDLQQGFGEAVATFFPGGSDYRVCFLGDSVWIVKELSPQESQEELWPRFCGHLFAVSSLLQETETRIGNPGLRVIMSYGRLFQLSRPKSWQHPIIAPFAANWYVLTGGSEALAKCDKAEHMGSKGGFEGGYCWHGILEQPNHYHGTPLYSIPRDQWCQPQLYLGLYHQMLAKADHTAELKFPPWR